MIVELNSGLKPLFLGLTSDQQIEKFLTLYKQLLTSKEGLPIPEKAWFELELGFVIISKHKGYHWIQGVSFINDLMCLLVCRLQVH